MTARSTHGFKGLSQSYVESLDTIDGDSIMSANFGPKVSVRRGHKDEIIVNADGVEMGWKAAIKSKLITLKRNG